jgi:hypothetical protein
LLGRRTTFAFGIGPMSVQNAMELSCKDVFLTQVKDLHSIVLISNVPHLALELLWTPIPEVKRRCAKASNNIVSIDVDDAPSDTESLTAGNPSESNEPMVLFDERDANYHTPPQPTNHAPKELSRGKWWS